MAGEIGLSNGKRKTISIEILDARVNEDPAWVRLAGWLGRDGRRRQVEDWITTVFQFELERLRVKAAKNGRRHETALDAGWIPHIRLLEPRDGEDALAKLN